MVLQIIQICIDFGVYSDSINSSGGYEAVQVLSEGTDNAAAYQRGFNSYIRGTDGFNVAIAGIAMETSAGRNIAFEASAANGASNFAFIAQQGNVQINDTFNSWYRKSR